MNQLSVGLPSTLGSYLTLVSQFFPEPQRSIAVAFIEKKIAESPQGKEEEVIAHETQMLYLLAHIKEGQT